LRTPLIIGKRLCCPILMLSRISEKYIYKIKHKSMSGTGIISALLVSTSQLLLK
jgi:hypothetical protein